MHSVHTEMGLVKYCAKVELTFRVANDEVGRETRWSWPKDQSGFGQEWRELTIKVESSCSECSSVSSALSTVLEYGHWRYFSI